ncbi:MAG: hypothetical protein ACK54R_02975, partial [Pirellulaceae bacterium]
CRNFNHPIAGGSILGIREKVWESRRGNGKTWKSIPAGCGYLPKGRKAVGIRHRRQLVDRRCAKEDVPKSQCVEDLVRRRTGSTNNLLPWIESSIDAERGEDDLVLSGYRCHCESIRGA